MPDPKLIGNGDKGPTRAGLYSRYKTQEAVYRSYGDIHSLPDIIRLIGTNRRMDTKRNESTAERECAYRWDPKTQQLHLFIIIAEPEITYYSISKLK